MTATYRHLAIARSRKELVKYAMTFITRWLICGIATSFCGNWRERRALSPIRALATMRAARRPGPLLNCQTGKDLSLHYEKVRPIFVPRSKSRTLATLFR